MKRIGWKTAAKHNVVTALMLLYKISKNDNRNINKISTNINNKVDDKNQSQYHAVNQLYFLNKC